VLALTRACWNHLSLSDIKFEHTDGVIRRELVSEECARQPQLPAYRRTWPYLTNRKPRRDRLKGGGAIEFWSKLTGEIA
jgi:hypothetical protein